MASSSLISLLTSSSFASSSTIFYFSFLYLSSSSKVKLLPLLIKPPTLVCMIIKGMSIFLKQSMIVSSDRVSLHKEFISLENKKYIEACVRARIVWKERKEKKKKGDREKRRERLVRASRVSAA